MKTLLHILYLEDCGQDAELVQFMFQAAGLQCKIERAETRFQLLEALERSECNLILSDSALPGFSGLHALELAQSLKPEIPFIFVSGNMDEETAAQALQMGATDYVPKNRLSRLIPAVRRALAEASDKATPPDPGNQ